MWAEESPATRVIALDVAIWVLRARGINDLIARRERHKRQRRQDGIVRGEEEDGRFKDFLNKRHLMSLYCVVSVRNLTRVDT